MLRAAPTSTSSPKSSSNAAAMRGKDSLTFVLHPKQLVALRSKATEILYGDANRGKRPVLSWSDWRHFEGRLTRPPMLDMRRRDFITLLGGISCSQEPYALDATIQVALPQAQQQQT